MNNLEKKLRDAEALLASVRMELEASKTTPKTIEGRYITSPELIAVCWYVDDEGIAVFDYFHSTCIDRNRLAQGNLFNSKYAAENEAAKRAYEQKMRGDA